MFFGEIAKFVFALVLSFILVLFKILSIILFPKLLVQLYDIFIVLRLNIVQYGWMSSKMW